MGRECVYSGSAYDTYRRITGDASNFKVNYFYKCKHCVYYINTKGYLHCITPRKVKGFDEVYIEVVDLLLTKDNKLKESRSWGKFRSIEEYNKYIENNVVGKYTHEI